MRYLVQIKTFLFIGCLLWGLLPGKAQTYHFQWSNVSLDSCINEIEAKTDLRFYYSKSWTKDVFITYDAESADQHEALIDSLFKLARLSYFLNENDVIVTTQPIIDRLQITEAEGVTSGSRFSRELGGGDDVLIIGSRVNGQNNGTISGTIVDINNNPVSGALVYVDQLKISTTTNQLGNYSITLPIGKHELQVQSLGYETRFQDILVYSNGVYNTTLEEQALVLEEVYVLSGGDRNVASTVTGLTKLDLEEAKTIPKVFGENDVVQVALALPGVQSVGEGAAGINVRGGKTDQNLVLFNDITLYNPFHFFGFFSAFNADIIGSTDLYKGSIPSEFGGRLSSILSVNMKPGDAENFSGKVGISPVTSKASVNVPIVKEKVTLVAGGRATYSDWITSTVNNTTIKNSDPSFYDGAGKITVTLSDKHAIEAFGYYSKDQFKLTQDSLFSYTNFGASIKWIYQINEQWNLKTTSAYSSYDFNVQNDQLGPESFEYGFNISDWYVKSLINLDKPNSSYTLGVDMKLYDLNPGFINPLGNESLIQPDILQNEKGREVSVFFSNEISLTKKLKGTFGFRYSVFSPLGPRSVSRYQENQLKDDASLIGTTTYTEGEVIDTYSGPEGRLSLNYLVKDDLSIKANFTTMRQYIHSLSNTVSVSPLDTWKLSDPNFKPQLSNQYSVGIYKNLLGNSVEVSAEAYYKTFDNIVDYKVGADLIQNPQLERDIIQGEGLARGLELLIRKKTGKLTGWIGYTYSRSEQKFASPFVEETINGGEFFPSNFDKPHDFSFISNYKINRRFSTSLNLIFTSGRPVTYPTAIYELSNREVVHFGDRNEFRIPNYIRVDIGVNVEPSHRKNNLLYTYWSFSVYNLFSRNNAYSVFFRNDENGEIRGYQLSVLASAIPSITYNVIF